MEKTFYSSVVVLCIMVMGFCSYEVYAGTVVKNQDLSYTYSPSPEETLVLEALEGELGKNILEETLNRWVEAQSNYVKEQKAKKLQKQYEGLTEDDRQKIQQMLEGKRLIR